MLNGLYLLPLLGGLKHQRRKRRRWLSSAKVPREFIAQALPAQRTETRPSGGRKRSHVTRATQHINLAGEDGTESGPQG